MKMRYIEVWPDSVEDFQSSQMVWKEDIYDWIRRRLMSTQEHGKENRDLPQAITIIFEVE